MDYYDEDFSLNYSKARGGGKGNKNKREIVKEIKI